MHPPHFHRQRIAWILYPILLMAAVSCWCLNLVFLARISALEHAIVVAQGTLEPDDMAKKSSEQTFRAVNRTSPYAYVWVMGGVHEDRPAYKGFLYDIIISVHLLKRLGSKADCYVWVQMAPDSKLDELPMEDVRLLQALDIRIQLLNKPEKESFASLVYDKFRTLQMVPYKRVMFLDADILPLVNLDYLFHLSDPNQVDTPTILRPSLILASRKEPCNTGMFLVEPSLQAWESLQVTIQQQHESAKDLPYPHFDFRKGWGHDFIASGDYWQGILRKGTRWRFHAGHSDQGLMYYFAKYVQQDVSIVVGNRLQNWLGTNQEGLPRLVFDVKGALDAWSPTPLAYQDQCDVKTPHQAGMNCFPPYRDVAHFMGDSKPWQKGQHPKNRNYRKWKDTTRVKFAPHKLWFQELETINKAYNMGLDVEHWDTMHLPSMKESPLGYMAMYKDQIDVIGGEAENNNTQTNVTLAESK